MAGLGYKQWAGGELVTVGNMQGYLQDQTVMVFASAAARAAAITAPAEGMLSYLKDTDQYESHNGTAWTTLANRPGTQYFGRRASAPTSGSGLGAVPEVELTFTAGRPGEAFGYAFMLPVSVPSDSLVWVAGNVSANGALVTVDRYPTNVRGTTTDLRTIVGLFVATAPGECKIFPTVEAPSWTVPAEATGNVWRIT